MSAQQQSREPVEAAQDEETEPARAEELAVELEYVQAENRRLRELYAHSRRTNYQRTALGLTIIGVIAIGGALILPDSRSILLSLGAIGLFSGVLTYYLTPERFIAADIGKQVYETLSSNELRLTEELSLTENQVFVPVDAPEYARLFIPQHEQYEVPPSEALANVLVIPDDPQQRGISFTPSGSNLYEEFTGSRSGTPPNVPTEILSELTDGLVELFEIVDSTALDLDTESGRASVTITNSAYGGSTQFDNPAASFIAVGLASALETPISVTITAGNSDEEFTATYRWSVE